MNEIEKLLERIGRDKPRIIYIAGKSCTGKTTLSNRIDDALGYYNVELDSIIDDIQAPPGTLKYYQIYRTRNEPELVAEFIEKASSSIRESVKEYPGVTFEGAIANNQTLRELFVSLPTRPLFVYLLPVDHTRFKQRIVRRFRDSSPTNKNKLNKEFWETTSKELVADFYKTGELSRELDAQIDTYVKQSMNEARERLKEFTLDFPDIEVVEV